MKKAMFITVGTGRNRRDITSAICFSIKKHNPDYVIFLTTDKTKKETMPCVLEDPVMKGRRYDVIEIGDEIDVEEIYSQCREAIEEVLNKGYEVSADYTSGTKPMSAGLCLAAVSKEIGDLIYITGKRDDTGRVIPTSERAYTLSPTLIYIDRELVRFRHLFNLYQYDACLSIAKGVRQRCDLPDTQKEWEFLEGLTSAYSAWDKFDLETAHKQLKELADSQYLSKYHLEETINRHTKILHKDKRRYCPERIADLLQNAKRRKEEGKFDDAVARCYRCMEYLAQYVLYKEYDRITTGNFESDKIKDPSIRCKYKDKKTLALKDAYELLSDLGDPLGKTFMEERNAGKLEFLDKRNNSILAHGFKPVGKEGCRESLEMTERYVRMIVRNLDAFEKEVAFPTL